MTVWDRRYDRHEYVYGTAPNDFLVEAARYLPPGPVLCLGEGEGRNAVYLAEQGYEVTAVDASSVGLKKAQQLATERAVPITTCLADLADFVIQPESWNGIVSIFCHLPPLLRAQVHRHCVEGLAPGGVFILEAYRPAQLQLKTGGPPIASLMMDLAILETELRGLTFKYAVESEREVHEGSLHNGLSAVVQIVAVKP